MSKKLIRFTSKDEKDDEYIDDTLLAGFNQEEVDEVLAEFVHDNREIEVFDYNGKVEADAATT